MRRGGGGPLHGEEGGGGAHVPRQHLQLTPLARRRRLLRKKARRLSIAMVIGLVGATSSHAARADDTIKRPGDHPHYSVELEPHVLVGWADQWAGTGFGIGGGGAAQPTRPGLC